MALYPKNCTKGTVFRSAIAHRANKNSVDSWFVIANYGDTYLLHSRWAYVSIQNNALINICTAMSQIHRSYQDLCIHNLHPGYPLNAISCVRVNWRDDKLTWYWQMLAWRIRLSPGCFKCNHCKQQIDFLDIQNKYSLEWQECYSHKLTRQSKNKMTKTVIPHWIATRMRGRPT